MDSIRNRGGFRAGISKYFSRAMEPAPRTLASAPKLPNLILTFSFE
jgi:hypothetical protein